MNLPFLSPTINMFETNKDFLKMVSDIPRYMNAPLKFHKAKYSKHTKLLYPIYSLIDVKLRMNHYGNFTEAKHKWESRVSRINYDNILLAFYTESKEELEEFDMLPYKKKVCFVPFVSDLASAFYLPRYEDETIPFARAVIDFAKGRYPYYDLWDLLLYGKATQRMVGK